MNDSKIPVRYSRALFELALQKGSLEKIYEDMGLIKQLCSMKEVREVLDNPVISSAKRREVTGVLLGGQIDPLTVKFLDLVFSEGRERYLVAMARDFIQSTRQHKGIREVTITTCVPINDSVRKNISAMVEKSMNSKVELIEKSDPDIVGGFILQVDDTYVDASVRSRLNRFRKEFGASFSK